MNDIALRIEHVSKKYDLGVINTGTFFRDVQTKIARMKGAPDPHAKLGMEFSDSTDHFWALKDILLDVKKGDRLALIGKNGAGKSTLLKLISRISAPTKGEIKINGRVASLLEVGTGFHGELTGRENIYLNGSILGMKKRQIDKKIDEIIDFSGIERHIDTPAKRYSSGMYVRLAFAVAAHLDSEILIADEVLAVGDAEFQKKALGKMNEVSKEDGRTVLFVSHNMGAVTTLCKSGIILDKGQMIFQGTIDDCVSNYIDKIETKSSVWQGSAGDNNLRLYKAVIDHSEFASLLTLELEILNEGIDYDFTLEFLSDNGQMIATCDLSDYLNPEKYNQLTKTGKHIISFNIDTTIFTTGTFYIRFDFAIYGIKRIIPTDIAISFDNYCKLFLKHPHSTSKNTVTPKLTFCSLI